MAEISTDHLNGSEEARFEALMSSIEEQVSNTFRGRKLPSLEDQLADL